MKQYKCPKCGNKEITLYKRKDLTYTRYNINCNDYICCYFRQYKRIKDLEKEWLKV